MQRTAPKLRELFQRAAARVGPGEVMIQDLIPGDGRQQFAYCAFFKEGRVLGSMVVRRGRQHSPEFGRASIFVETIELPLIEELSERFLRAIDYYGLVEPEYKLDPRDGQYRLLDVNGRTWGYHLGYSAGVDFPFMLFADQAGESVQPQRGRTGVSWIRLITDVPTGILGMLRGHQDCREYLRSIREFHVESVLQSRGSSARPPGAWLASLPVDQGRPLRQVTSGCDLFIPDFHRIVLPIQIRITRRSPMSVGSTNGDTP